MYKLGYYTEDGDMKTFDTTKTIMEAKDLYRFLRDSLNCTIWVQEIKFVDTKDW